MSEKSSFAEILISQIGKPKEPLGLSDALFGVVLLLGMCSYLALEYGVVHLVRRFFQRLTRKL